MHSTQEKIRSLVIGNKRTIKSFTRNNKSNCNFKNFFIGMKVVARVTIHVRLERKPLSKESLAMQCVLSLYDPNGKSYGKWYSSILVCIEHTWATEGTSNQRPKELEIHYNNGVYIRPWSFRCQNEDVYIRPWSFRCQNEDVYIRPWSFRCQNEDVYIRPWSFREKPRGRWSVWFMTYIRPWSFGAIHVVAEVYDLGRILRPWHSKG